MFVGRQNLPQDFHGRVNVRNPRPSFLLIVCQLLPLSLVLTVIFLRRPHEFLKGLFGVGGTRGPDRLDQPPVVRSFVEAVFRLERFPQQRRGFTKQQRRDRGLGFQVRQGRDESRVGEIRGNQTGKSAGPGRGRRF